MQGMAKDAARQSAPWRPSQSWWLVGIEGVIALIIGIYILIQPLEASDAIRNLIALALLIASIVQIVESFRSRRTIVAPWASLRAGIGALTAAMSLLAFWSDFFDIGPTGARQLLAVGLLAYGLIGIVALVFTFRTAGFTIAGLIIDLLAIALGIVLITAEVNDTRGTQLLGAAAIVGGAALLAYAYILWTRRRTAVSQPPPPDVSPA